MVRLELIVVGPPLSFFFFFNDTATTEIYTLSLHDALPICMWAAAAPARAHLVYGIEDADSWATDAHKRSEEHTSELQSRLHLVCRLLLEKKKKSQRQDHSEHKQFNDMQTRHDITVSVDSTH